MSALERMARAMQESPAWPAVYDAGTAHTLARAALMAIREPDLMTTVAGAKVIVKEMKGDEDYFAAKGAWTAMIDHVLKEGEG